MHFTRSIAPKLAGQGVRLCAVCPQPVDTPMVASMKGLGLPLPETGEQLLTPGRVRSNTFSSNHSVAQARQGANSSFCSSIHCNERGKVVAMSHSCF